jgi:hypothetical protein
MAKIEQRGRIECECVVRLTEEEMTEERETFTGRCVGGPKHNEILRGELPRLFVSGPLPLPSMSLGAMPRYPAPSIAGHYDFEACDGFGYWHWSPSR